MTDASGLFHELQRRSVVRAAIAHVVFFWVLAQVADVVLPYIGIVENPVRWAVVAGVALFPVTLILAWFFEHPWKKYTRSRLAIDLVIIVAIGAVAADTLARAIGRALYHAATIGGHKCWRDMVDL